MQTPSPFLILTRASRASRAALGASLALFACLWATWLTASPAAAMSDRLGEFSLNNFFLEPSADYIERRAGGFGFGNSFIEANWTNQSYLSAVLKLGSSDLIGKPERYGDEPAEQVQFIEAYGQLESDSGQLRAGLIPIAFGLEGGDNEANLRFPRSLLFSQRVVGLRDQGVSYRITNEGFFSDWVVSNGEGGPDLDERLWFTARMGWEYGRFFKTGLSVQTGNTTTKATNPTATLTAPSSGFDPTRPSHVRLADVFMRYGAKSLGVEVEAAAGDTLQTGTGPALANNSDQKLQFIRADVDWQFWRGLTLLSRFDVLDPDTSTAGDLKQEVIAGLAWRDAYETSVLTLLFSKITDQATQTSHEVQLIWRLTPIAMGRLNPL